MQHLAGVVRALGYAMLLLAFGLGAPIGLAQAQSTTRADVAEMLKKWSQAVIGGVVLGTLVPGSKAEAGWVNSRGSWVNGGGGGWANRGGSWVNGGGSWVNRGGSWVNGGRGGGSWVNRRGW